MVLCPLLLLLLGGTVSTQDIDYVQDGFMSEVDDQGSCGGCYAFALTSALEWYVGSVTGKSVPISNQYWVDCQKDEQGNAINGCSGGVVTYGLKHLMATQYQPYAADYKFTADFDAEKCSREGFDGRRRNALADVWIYSYDRVQQSAEGMKEALQHGPVIAPMLISEDFIGMGAGINTDSGCTSAPLPHALNFAGWQSNNGRPYYIIRNSYGPKWGVDGYAKYADNVDNEHCGYYKNAVTVNVGPRHEIEYVIGKGKKRFDDAKASCQALGDGWNLATIPTLKHNLEVYDLFTKKFGTDRKADNSFNYFWIGMFKGNWVDRKTPNTYQNWENGRARDRFFHVAMNKVNDRAEEIARGKWVTQQKIREFRFVCSRYRNEACPRISQTEVEDAESLTFITGGEPSLEINVGTSAVVECIPGYNRVGPPKSACLPNGEWAPLARCVSA